MINSVEKTLHSMNGKVFHHQNPDKSGARKETFGFKTSKPAPKAKELIEFRDGMLYIIKNCVTTNKTNYRPSPERVRNTSQVGTTATAPLLWHRPSVTSKLLVKIQLSTHLTVLLRRS